MEIWYNEQVRAEAETNSQLYNTIHITGAPVFPFHNFALLPILCCYCVLFCGSIKLHDMCKFQYI